MCSLAAVRESRLVYLPRHFQWRVKMGHLGLFWLAGVVVLAFLDPPLKMTWQEICVARNIMTSRTTRTTEDGGLLLAGGCGFGAPACFSGRRSGGLVLALADVGWWQCCTLPSLKVLHVRHSGEHRLRYPDLIGCTFLREPPFGVVFGSKLPSNGVIFSLHVGMATGCGIVTADVQPRALRHHSLQRFAVAAY